MIAELRRLAWTALSTARKLAEIFNTDEGAQFTAGLFVERVLPTKYRRGDEHGRRGLWLDKRLVERLWRSCKKGEIRALKELDVVAE